MGLEYIQLWADMESLFEPYDDAQRGRLVMAMMAYAYRGEEPNFAGVEKFIWPVLRQHIDRCAQSIEAKKAAGSKGGKGIKSDKQPKAEESKSKQSEADASKEKQMEAENGESKQNAHTQYQYHDHEHDHDQDNVVVDARARATATPAAEPVTAFDGSDLAESIAIQREVERMIKRFGLADNDATMDALLDDVGHYGLLAVEAALENASKSDSRGGLSIKYYRTFLGAKPRSEPNKSVYGHSEQQVTSNPFLQMLREEGYGT